MTERASNFPTDHRGGNVHNYASGNIGSLIQAGDITGGINMGGGGYGTPTVQVGGYNVAEADERVYDDVLAFLDRIAADDLGRRSTEAADLAERMRETLARQ